MRRPHWPPSTFSAMHFPGEPCPLAWAAGAGCVCVTNVASGSKPLLPVGRFRQNRRPTRLFRDVVTARLMQ